MSAEPSTSLPGEAWARLLEALAPDPARQGAAYERVRHRVETFFRYRGAVDPGQLADVTFDRVARKLAQDAVSDLSSPIPYFLSVARFVWLEHARDVRKARRAAEASPLPPQEDPRAKEAHLSALEACLEALMGGQRKLIERYHEGRGQGRIRARARLAEDLGISDNALRIRAHRIRATLEKCVRGRLEAETKRAPES